MGRRVLELGAGCGMPGLVAGEVGAKEVWLTDRATVMARANLEMNFEQRHRKRFHVHQLSWGDQAHVASTTPPFDVLLGADINYNVADLVSLASTIDMLSKIGTVVWWATADGNCNDPTSLAGPFWSTLQSLGFELTDMTETEAVQAATRDLNSWTSLLSHSPLERLADYLVRDRRYFIGTQVISVTRMVKTE